MLIYSDLRLFAMRKLSRNMLKIRRVIHSLFHSNPIFKKNNNYFLNQFLEKTNGYNIEAIDFSEGLTTADFKGNRFLMNFRPGDFIETAIHVDGCWGRHLTTLISQILDKSSGVMLDIGANIGANTIPLAVEHDNIKFYCYEPHPEVFHRLKSNVRLNRLDNVLATNCAISNSEEETLSFYAQKNSLNMGLSSLRLNPDIDEYDEITVPISGVDKMFEDSSEAVSVIKIDTQGAEPMVLQSASQTIKRDRPVIFFEFEDEYYSDDEREDSKKFLEDFFRSMDYSLFNVTHGFDYYPKINIRQKYHGDILAVPN